VGLRPVVLPDAVVIGWLIGFSRWLLRPGEGFAGFRFVRRVPILFAGFRCSPDSALSEVRVVMQAFVDLRTFRMMVEWLVEWV